MSCKLNKFQKSVWINEFKIQNTECILQNKTCWFYIYVWLSFFLFMQHPRKFAQKDNSPNQFAIVIVREKKVTTMFCGSLPYILLSYFFCMCMCVKQHASRKINKTKRERNAASVYIYVLEIYLRHITWCHH